MNQFLDFYSTLSFVDLSMLRLKSLKKKKEKWNEERKNKKKKLNIGRLYTLTHDKVDSHILSILWISSVFAW